jgi:MFS family permease
MNRRAGRPEAGPSEHAMVSAAIRRWWLLAACFVTFMISAAFMQSYTVFLVAFIETFGWSRGEASIAYAVSQFVSGVTSLLVGVLVDRLGPRRLILIGGALLALGLIFSSYVHALWQVVLLYGIIMTLGANCLGLVENNPHRLCQ